MASTSARTRDAHRTASPPPPRRRRTLGVALSAAALTGVALLAAPPVEAAPRSQPSGASPTALRSHETPSDAVVTGGGVVTLITGDRVRVTTYSDGRTVGTVLPGSPHAGGPLRTFHSNDASYLIPLLPINERAKLDTSLFNLTALLGQPTNQVTVSVRFAPGIRPHPPAGLQLDRAGAHRAPGGSMVVPAHYSTSVAGKSPRPDALRGVALIALPTGRPAELPPGLATHELTVHVTDLHGDPVGYEDGWVLNLDNARLFSEPITIVNGVGTVTVPEGNYAVLAGSFLRLLVDADVTVEADTDIAMSLTSATVHPTEFVSGFQAADSTVVFQLDSERGGGFGQGLTSFQGFPLRLQPVLADLPHGAANSSVAATLVPTSELAAGVPTRQVKTLIYAKDYRAGVPESMRFRHVEGDYAEVPQRFFANHAAGTRTSEAVSFAPFEFFGVEVAYDVPVPGERTVLLQGDPTLLWSQDFDAIPASGDDFPVATLSRLGRYSAGVARPVVFAHGPVGPGIEAGYDLRRTGPFCILCRAGDRLRGFMTLFSGAGTAMFGQLSTPEAGSWELTQGDTTLDSGRFLVAPHVTLPPEPLPYTLTAVSHPNVADWLMSTSVTDEWHFWSRSGDAVIPLLMPSYVPRTALDGTLRPGHVRWPLDFGNLGPANRAVAHASVSLSTDGGRTWHHATVSRVDRNSFAVTYDNPASSGGSPQYMTLRVSGTDASGRTVTETAINAYRLTTTGTAR